MNEARNRASHLLRHYLVVAGVQDTIDTTAEVDEIVDSIIDATIEKLDARMTAHAEQVKALMAGEGGNRLQLADEVPPAGQTKGA